MVKNENGKFPSNKGEDENGSGGKEWQNQLNSAGGNFGVGKTNCLFIVLLMHRKWKLKQIVAYWWKSSPAPEIRSNANNYRVDFYVSLIINYNTKIGSSTITVNMIANIFPITADYNERKHHFDFILLLISIRQSCFGLTVLVSL